ncbi:MAG: hypothetical protein ABJC79_15310 [Acidimicrobiia bacterium]
MTTEELPYVDEHATTIAASVDDVWAMLTDRIDHAFSHGPVATFAGAVGCESTASTGPRPLVVGSTIPGFRVARAVYAQELVLEGRHRFSSYALTFRLEPMGPVRTRLRAETRAAFPGFAGGTYRLLVITTGGHVVAVRRLLTDVKRRCETPLPLTS